VIYNTCFLFFYTSAQGRLHWQRHSVSYWSIHSVRLSVTKVVSMICWKRMNRFLGYVIKIMMSFSMNLSDPSESRQSSTSAGSRIMPPRVSNFGLVWRWSLTSWPQKLARLYHALAPWTTCANQHQIGSLVFKMSCSKVCYQMNKKNERTDGRTGRKH